MIMKEGFKCSCCGEFHEGLPLDYGAEFPDYYFEIPAEEREERVYADGDICVVDDEYFFIRGCIEIPILDGEDSFVWGVWCSLSEKSFKRTMELQDAEDAESEPPFFGWLNTSLPEEIYPETLNLKTNVYLRNNNQRPFIELQPCEHPLAIEQRSGITMKRVREIAEIILHK
jgi:hypothetical protein